jgi:hypothetical protein
VRVRGELHFDGCSGDRQRKRDQRIDGELAQPDAVTGAQPGRASYRQCRPFEWELRHIRQQPVAPAAEGEPDRDRVLPDQRGDQHVAEASGQPPARPAEDGQQERGSQDPEVVGDQAGELAERSVQRRVRSGARSEPGSQSCQQDRCGGEQRYARGRRGELSPVLAGCDARQASARARRNRAATSGCG